VTRTGLQLADTLARQAPDQFSALLHTACLAGAPRRTGSVTAIVGLTVWVQGVDAAVGELVHIRLDDGADDVAARTVGAEVTGVGAAGLACMTLGPVAGIRVGCEVVPTGSPLTIQVGWGLQGRVLDGLGRPLDGLGPIERGWEVPVEADAPHPLERQRIMAPLSLGVRALDTLTPVGRGQRIGLFAGSGVGKSTLLSMVARGTEADVNVVALVGERGREVREFLENDLGPQGLARSVVVVATSDQPPMVRLRAAFVATRIAEWFREEGASVLLLMDSVTRVATAQREVGLSAGEPPATRGYPPSVFALLPRLLERAGASARGSITGIYTVLVEGDDHNEPIGDAARAILDGHVVLSRRLATSGHFPSIDVLESVSRLFTTVTTAEQREDAIALRRLLAAYREARELVEIGAYVPGTNPEVDAARVLMPAIDAFLRQDVADLTAAPDSWAALRSVLAALGTTEARA